MKPQILYEDNHLIAVFKPAGVLVQADAPGGSSFMDEIKDFIKKRDKKPGKVFLGLVHRLDRQVSGIVLFAKTSKGAARLSEQFRDRTVNKTYTALVEGRITPASGTLTHWLRKNPETLKAEVFDTARDDAQKAALSYRVVKSNVKCSLLNVSLETGRFHQIRAQLSHIGHPIVGDTKYGSKQKLPDGSIALCATELEFRTATTDEAISLSIPHPKEWDLV